VLFSVILIPRVPLITARRGVNRPHSEQHHQREDEAYSKPADFFFVMKVTDPCGAAREVCESVTREEVMNMVEIVRGEIIEAKQELVSLKIVDENNLHYIFYQKKLKENCW
jgi:hypothetical protein